MTNKTKARAYAVAGVLIGAIGFGDAVYRNSVVAPFCGVMWGATLTLSALAWCRAR